jgi:ferredoxin, 2Fe-2S
VTIDASAKARITFRDPPVEVEVPIGISLLEAAMRAGATNVGPCGGNCACGGCHVRIEEGANLLSSASEKEEDQLDQVFDVRPSSRLACQARVIAGGDITVRKVCD